jgi:hypothetical protein
VHAEQALKIIKRMLMMRLLQFCRKYIKSEHQKHIFPSSSPVLMLSTQIGFDGARN